MLYMDTTVETGGDTSSTDAYSKGQGFIEQITELKSAFQAFIIAGKDIKAPFENAVKMFSHMQDSAMSIQRSMGGVAYSFIKTMPDGSKKLVNNTTEIQSKLMDSFKSTQGINASFEDSVKALSSLATVMGRIVNPSTEVLENMVALSKTTQLTSEEVGAMVGAMVRFGGNQKEATVTMSKLAGEARKVGINTKSYMKEVSDNMKLLNGFGFKSGVEGVKKMAKEALTLRSTIEKIGATKFQNSILDPEGAIEAAANIQMLGGAVGKLADPFQLMYMAQSDVAGLQTELLNASKAAFTFNTETGGFDASTEDLYRLREMAKATNTDFDGLVEAGREAQKLDYISSKFDLSTIPKESQGLLASLAEIDKGGKVSIDLPGYEEGQQSLEQMMKDPVFVDKLKEYNEQSMLSEKEIAQHSLSVSEEQARDVNIIKNAVVLGIKDRGDLNLTLKESNATAKEALTKASEALGGQLAKEVSPLVTTLANETNKAVNQTTGYGSPEDLSKQSILAGTIKAGIKAIKDSAGTFMGDPTVKVKDMFIPANGGAPKVMAANKIFQGIVGDDVAMGTNLREGLNMAANKVAGKMDININIGGSVGGDSSNNINKIFEDPKVQKQIMDTVLYKLESYKKQQGVLA